MSNSSDALRQKLRAVDLLVRNDTRPADCSSFAAAWKNMTFTNDPIASSLKTSADNAIALDLLKPVDLSKIYDLGPLNEVLKAAGQPAINEP